MSKEKNIIVSIRFNGTLKQEEAIIYFTKYFKEKYDKIFAELNYTITDKNKFYWKLKNKGGKYTEKNFDKFKKSLNQINENVFIEFELLSTLKEYEYKSRDIDLSITYGVDEEIKFLNITLNTLWVKSEDIKELVKETISFLLKQNCNILYGYAFAMSNNKFPSIYSQGIITENLTTEEKYILTVWSENARYCENKIWNIFWGNIISKKHIQINTKSEIENLIGKENLIELAQNLYWFNIPEEIAECDFTKSTAIKIKLLQHFKENKLLM